MSVDGPILNSESNTLTGDSNAGEIAFLAGSKALHSLNTIITSTETYFHPSNHGQWTINVISIHPFSALVDDSDLPVQLTTFMQRLAYEFSKRWNEEHQPECKTPIVRLPR
jgi:proteasome activator subunit 4